MDLCEKAKYDIKLSLPYFYLLIDETLTKKLRRTLIQEAPKQLFITLTQIARHYLNGSFCNVDKQFCARYKKALLLLSDPSTTLKDKQLVVELESSEFVKELFNTFEDCLKK